jgi:serine/threonine protein kinase
VFGGVRTLLHASIMTNFISLGLSNNLLKEIPYCVFNLITLKRLDLQGNRIQSVLAGISKLTKLQRLFLGGNLVQDVHPSLGGLIKQLDRLDLRKNKLQLLPPSIWALPDDVLQLDGNPLVIEVPPAIRETSVECIQGALQEHFGGNIIWPFVKLLVVGEEGVGKTSLLKRLGGNMVHDGISTDGVQISQVKVPGFKEQLLFKTYDFGGQEVFYPTHMFFLSVRSIYIVVFNALDKDASQRASYWLANIRVATDGTFPPPMILLVGTHCKSNNFDQSICESWIRSAKVQNTVFVDNKFNDGFDRLQEALNQAALKSGLSNFSVPSYYKVVVDLLAERMVGLPIWSWEAFVLTASCFCVSPEEWLIMTRFLHDTGVLIFLEQPEISSSLVVLNPQWLADRMSDVVSFKHNWASGTVSKSVLQFVWNKQGVEADTQEYLVQIFVRLGIFFEKPGSGKTEFIAPSLLPQIEPIDTSALRFECGRDYKLDIMPLGLFGRIQVRVISEPDVLVEAVWRNGVLIQKKGETALILAEENSVIIVRVKGVALMAFIVETVETVIKSVFTRFKACVSRTVPCSHCIRMACRAKSTFSFKECAEAAKAGVLKLMCCSVPVYLSELAPDIMMKHVPLVQNLTLDRVIGKGGFGIVYLGKLSSGSEVAVKELSSERSDVVEEHFRELQHEISMISTLRHENLVHFVGITTNPIRLVMEFCPLPDLSKHLHSEDLLPRNCFGKKVRIKFAFDIAKGMQYLHAQIPCIVHRDLRSPNVFVMSLDSSAEVNVKVGDFGLAVHVMGTASEFLATWQWVAPEILSGKSYNEKSDVYSFGIVLHEIATRMFPFDEFVQFVRTITEWVEYDSNGIAKQCKGKKEIWKEHEARTAIIKSNLRPSIPSDCEFGDLIRMCWHGEAQKRPSFEECLHFFSKTFGLNAVMVKTESTKVRSPTVHTLTALDFDASCFCMLEDVAVVAGSSATLKGKSTRFSFKRTEVPGISGTFALFGSSWLEVSKNLKANVAICKLLRISEREVWSVGLDGQIFSWKVEKLNKKARVSFGGGMKQSGKWQAHKDRILCFGKVDEVIFSGDVNGCLRGWDQRTMKMVQEYSVEGPVMCCCTWGSVLIVGSRNVMYMIDAGIVRPWKYEGSAEAVCAVGSELWCTGENGITVCDLNAFPPNIVAVLGRDSMQFIVAYRDLARDIIIFSASKGGRMYCWSACSRSLLWEVNIGCSVAELCTSKKAEKVVVVTGDRRILTFLE